MWLARFAGRTWRDAKDWIKRQRATRQLLQLHRRELRPGFYLVNRSLACRLGSVAPDHLRRRVLFGRPLPAIPALLIGNRRASTGYECMIAGNGGVLMLGGSTQTVKRIAQGPVFDHAYASMRDTMTKQHIPAPSFRIESSGQTLVESLVPGVDVKELGAARVGAVVKQLVAALASLTHSEARAKSDQYLDEVVGALQQPALPSELLPWLPYLKASRLITEGPLVPSHGDLFTKNVLATDSCVWVIDWDPSYLRLRPFWYDAMTLVSSSPSLRQRFLDGEFLPEFASLFAACGLQMASSSAAQLLVVAQVLTSAPFPPSAGLGSAAHLEAVWLRYDSWDASFRQHGGFGFESTPLDPDPVRLSQRRRTHS